MSSERIAYLDAQIFTVPLEGTAGELGPIVSDNPIRDPKSTDDGLDIFYCGLLTEFDHRGHFRPLGELVNADIEKPILSDGAGRRPHDVQPPHSKGP
jgi:hypothetical protein